MATTTPESNPAVTHQISRYELASVIDSINASLER